MKKNIWQLLIPVIHKAAKESEFNKISAEDITLDIPANSRFGDLSTNIALKLASMLKQSPQEIASHLVLGIRKHLSGSSLADDIKEVKVEGTGFINFYFNNEYFYEELKDLLLKGEGALKQNIGRNKRVLIEFVSANPTGPLSVAHARAAAVGDALANVLIFCGFRAEREYYLNDEGNQINILGNSVALRMKELEGERVEFPEDHYQGDYIYDIAKQALDKKITASKLGEYATLYILEIIKKELSDFGVKFDNWYSQKALGESGKIEKALKFLEKKDFVFQQDGAHWFKSSAFGDDKDRVVIKSDGSYTYLAPDIAYHQDKYKRGFEQLINIWGPDHHGYINRVKAAVSALGYGPQTFSVIIVQLASIYKDGKVLQMSTRRGQYITLKEVLDEVGVDAARFFFLMRRTSSHLDFDLDVAKKQTQENPVYYIQYAHARICSILRNSPIKVYQNLDFSHLKEKEEIELIKKAMQFSYCLSVITKTHDPYMLTVYLQELAESFHKFYDQHRVLSDDEELTQARLGLIQVVKIILAAGLDLLGVSKPEQM